MAMLNNFFPVSMTTPSNPFAADTPLPWLAMSPWLSQAPAWPSAPGAVERPPGMLPPGAKDPAVLPEAAAPASGPAPFSLSGGMPATSMSTPALPQGSLLDRIGQGINDNSGLLMALGAGLAGSSSLGEGFSRGLQLAQAGGATDRKRRNENATAQFLRSKGYSEADAAAIAGNPTVLQSVLAQAFGKGATSDIQEYEYAKKQGFTGSLADWMAQKRAGAGEFSLTPVWGQDAAGNTVLIQPGKSGAAIQSKLPEGVKLSTGVEKLDLGTRWAIQDKRTGQILSYEPKDLAGAEAEKKIGEARGVASVALPAAETTTKRALRSLDELEKHPGFGDAVGFVLGRLPALTSKAADFRERVEQVDAMVFGDAVEVMRGLGALTDKEGPRITAARARLNTAKSEEDYRAALKDVREVFQTGIENLRKKASAAVAPPGAVAESSAASGLPAPPAGFQVVQ